MPILEIIACLLSGTDTLSPRHAVLWSGYFSLLVVSFYLLWVHLKRTYVRRWYGPPSGAGKKPGWVEVRCLMKRDPLKFGCKDCPSSRLWKRISWSWRMVRDLVLVAPLVFGFGSVAVWLRRSGADLSIATLESAATVVGAGSILVAAFGVFYQGRIKSRAENRQKWISELREEINAVIADIPHCSDHQYDWPLERKMRALETRHAKIELYLNPSERVHRAFMSLIRYMYGQTTLAIDEVVFDKLWDGVGNRPDLKNEECWKNTKSDAIRLANVLLKREWEQVKLIA